MWISACVGLINLRNIINAKGDIYSLGIEERLVFAQDLRIAGLNITYLSSSAVSMSSPKSISASKPISSSGEKLVSSNESA